MIIKNAEFVISAVGEDQCPKDDLPEITLAGRSNVGKSSLINKIINRKNLARTSSQPGKTQTLNYYKINEEFYFVDLPGYGFAKVSKEIKNKWAKFINDYLSTRESLVGVIHIIDLRHSPTAEDCMMYDWLAYFELPTLVVATKADKISKGKWQQHVKEAKTKLKLPADQQLVVFSAITGEGLPEIKKWIKERL